MEYNEFVEITLEELISLGVIDDIALQGKPDYDNLEMNENGYYEIPEYRRV